METKICQWCKKEKTSNKEHLIVEKRLKEIRSQKPDIERNDNIRKDFRGITCSHCNSKLKLPEENDILLSYITIWKLLAGNLNKVFDRYPNFILTNSSKETIKDYAEIIKQVVEYKMILPYNTLNYYVDFEKSVLKNDSYSYILPIKERFIDEITKEPIAGVAISISGNFIKDKSINKLTDNEGRVNISVPMMIEKLFIFNEEITLRNLTTLETIKKSIDTILYLSFRAERGRLITYFPLIGEITTPWSNQEIQIEQESIIEIINKNIPEYGISEIFPIF